MIPFTISQQELFENAKICYICTNKLIHKYTNDKNYHKFKDHSHNSCKYRGPGINICNLKCNISKEFEFERAFNCLGEKSEKYKIFSNSTTKEVKRIDKNESKITKNISYNLQFINNAKFNVSSLLNVKCKHAIKSNCKHGHDNKKCKTYGIK